MNKLKSLFLIPLAITGLFYGSSLLVVAAGPILGIWIGRFIGDALLIFTPVGILLCLISGLIMLCSSKTKQLGTATALSGVLLLILFVPALLLQDRTKLYALSYTVQRAEPLITAIEDYQRANNALPANIGELVPQYLAAIPYGLPDIRYVHGKDGRWMISADVGTGMLNWDELIYISDQDYSKYGTATKPIGKWVYYYE